MAPLDLSAIAGTWPYFLIFFIIGLGFGSVLEMAGFGDSRKLAAQFYLKDMTVLKVMFTAIIVAAVLVFFSSSLGLLDFDRVFVPPTYLTPGIVGGLIMGVGFIIGGFCPGTSVVSASTLKGDGAVFLLGVTLGIGLFSETAEGMMDFWYGTYYGRVTVGDFLNVPNGIAALLVVMMALIMFYAGEMSEAFFGRGVKASELVWKPESKAKLVSAMALVGVAGATVIIGPPTAETRLSARSDIVAPLENRAVFVHPGEVVEWLADTTVIVRILDVRPERDHNLFHVLGSIRTTKEQLESDSFINDLKASPDNTINFIVSNGERDATVAYRILAARGVPNLYIIEGGINNWLTVYPPSACIARPIADRSGDDEALAFDFERAAGSSCYAAHPEATFKERPVDCIGADMSGAVRPNPLKDRPKPEFEHKVKIQKKSQVKGGCG